MAVCNSGAEQCLSPCSAHVTHTPQAQLRQQETAQPLVFHGSLTRRAGVRHVRSRDAFVTHGTRRTHKSRSVFTVLVPIVPRSPRCPSALIARRTRQCCLSSSLPTPERVTVPPRLRPHEKKSCTSRSSCSGRLPSGSRPIFSLAVVMALCTGADASTPTSCLTKRSLWFQRAFWSEWLCEAVKAGVRVVGLAAHGLLACCVAFP